MRTAFINTLFEAAQKNPKIFLLVGDLGFGVVSTFAEKLPQQFLNVGIAEQNMASVATGLALSGYTVFAYSIANFPTLRAVEQIRNDICYHNANVKIVAVGGGLSYGALGISHHATEDLAIMRALPNMMIASPGDPQEARLITNALVDYHGPAYLRLGRAGDTSVHQNLASIDLKNPLVLESGQDLAIIVTGGVLPQAMEATNILKSKGLGVKLISMPILKPLDQSRLLAYLEGIPAIFTVEEHSIVGGLGSLLAETLLESGYAPRIFHRIGLPNHQFHEAIGSRDFMLHHYGLDAAGIVYTVESILQARHAYGIS